MAEVDSGKRYNRVLEIIEKRLIPDEEAKKARGEVFTPLKLVREMLFGLRKSAIEQGRTEIWGLNADGDFFDDDESDRVGGIPLPIFRDAESKWLDPANGIGNFPVVAFYMLDYQLNKHGINPLFKGDENTKKRREHIVKNMLYMIELNKGNVNASIKIFHLIAPDVKPNVCCANTLEMTDDKLKGAFGVNRFHVVMGNPPFQEMNKEGVTIGGKIKLYQKIIIKCLDFIKGEGYLNMVIPDNLFSGNSVAGYSEMLQRNIININNNNITLHNFPNVGQKTLHFLLQNSKQTGKTLIIDNDVNLSEIKIEDVKLTPLVYWNSKTEGLFKKLICRTDACGLDFKYVREEMKNYSNKGVGRFQIMINPELIKSTNEEKVAHGIKMPKIIIFRVKDAPAFIDSKGVYGSGPETYYYMDKDILNLENLKVFFDSRVFRCIRKLTTTSQYLKNPKYLDLAPLLHLGKKLEEKEIYSILSVKKEDIDNILEHFDRKLPKKTRAVKRGGVKSRRFTRKIRR